MHRAASGGFQSPDLEDPDEPVTPLLHRHSEQRAVNSTNAAVNSTWRDWLAYVWAETL